VNVCKKICGIVYIYKRNKVMLNRKKQFQTQPQQSAVESPTEKEETGNELELKVSVKIGNRIIENDINECLHIPTVDKLNPVYLANMMAEIPQLHARWNILYNEAVFDYDILKTKFEVWISRKSREYRGELNKIEKGRITEGMINEAVQLDPEYTKLNDAISEAKKNMKHILALANGFGEKGERIVNIASMMKWEGEVLGKGGKVGETKYTHIGRREVEEIEQKKDLSKNSGWPT
jgi:hypothetical protein